jgi:hypothetical protein
MSSGFGGNKDSNSGETELTADLMFCSYHQGFGDAVSGSMLMRNRTKKWMCGRCMALRRIAMPVIATSAIAKP